MTKNHETILHQGKYLQLIMLNGWEVARRRHASGVVAIVPVFGDGRVLLVEQERVAAGGSVIEWPAGLVGDEGEAEEMLEAAKRELLEETGYVAERWKMMGEGMSSAGLTDESVVFYVARGLKKKEAGGGVGGEKIVCHAVGRESFHVWLEEMKRAGKRVSLTVYAGLAMLDNLERKTE